MSIPLNRTDYTHIPLPRVPEPDARAPRKSVDDPKNETKEKVKKVKDRIRRDSTPYPHNFKHVVKK